MHCSCWRRAHKCISLFTFLMLSRDNEISLGKYMQKANHSRIHMVALKRINLFNDCDRTCKVYSLSIVTDFDWVFHRISRLYKSHCHYIIAPNMMITIAIDVKLYSIVAHGPPQPIWVWALIIFRSAYFQNSIIGVTTTVN